MEFSIFQQEVNRRIVQQGFVRLIPVGYLGFLLLPFLAAWFFFLKFPETSSLDDSLRSGAWLSLLFSASNGLAYYSFARLDTMIIVLFSMVYLIGVLALMAVFHFVRATRTPGRILLRIILIFILLVITGIVIQNL